ncbi:MAG: ABC transporter substrate-binding protein [Sulfurimonas sp.]|nr:ABC transporter substrate-binding protein [Sulfurimonas sp.]MDQ7059898.1 ABC transporter substrate-binding protein [Sulfurimonas sp.]
MKTLKIFLLCIIFINLYASEIELEKIKLQLQWKHQFEFAGFYAAQEKGFYKDVGLDVEFVEFDNDTNVVDSVLTEDIDYGLSYSSIIAEYLHGKEIVFVANFFKQSPLVLITQENITSLSQLKAAKIQGLSFNINNLNLYAMLNKFDIKKDDIELIPLNFSLEAFKNKEVDAIAGFLSNEPYALDKMNVKYNIFDPISYGITYYDTNLLTSKTEAQNHPERVESFKEASIKGWTYALKHKEEIIDLILKKYNTQNKTKEALLFEANQVEHLMLVKVHDIGSIDISRVEILAEDFMQSGFVKETSKYNIQDFIFKSSKNTSHLTKKERKYLEEKKVLTICVDPDWMPIEAVVDAKHVGIASDYWNLFEQKLDIPIKIFKSSSWNGSLNAMEQDKCDVLSLSAPTDQRKKTILFTDSFLELSFVIVTQIDKNPILDFSLLDGKSIAVVQGYALIDSIKIRYPNIRLVEVQNLEAGLKKVTDGEVFGFADSAVAIDYAYKNGSYNDFKVSAHFDEKLNLGLGVAKNNTQLFTILQKVVQSISYEQKQNILRKWFFTKYESKFNYTLFIQLMIFALGVLSFILYRHYSIKKLNKELKIQVQKELDKSSDKDKMIFHQNKLVAMGEMMENIAHQWRQPLSHVNSCVLVIDDTLDEQGIRNEIIGEKLHEIESLTLYMSNTIDDFRNFFDHNKIKTNTIIEDIIKKALAVLKAKTESNGIEILIDLRMAHEFFTYANELQQVFLAILNNAIDALVSNDVKKPNIKIEIQKQKEKLVINICDNAGGIALDIADKIFEPYYTTKHKAQGTGLGLYISKLIIEDSLAGELSVKNNFSGACFTIRLGGVNNWKKN